jgi:hypothetical protein
MTFDQWKNKPGSAIEMPRGYLSSDRADVSIDELLDAISANMRRAWDAAWNMRKYENVCENERRKIWDMLTKPNSVAEGTKFTMEEPMFTNDPNFPIPPATCQDCKSCEGLTFHGEILACGNRPDGGFLKWVLPPSFERCPWPSKRVEKKTKFEKFIKLYDMVTHANKIAERDPRPYCPVITIAQMENCLRDAGYEEKEGGK